MLSTGSYALNSNKGTRERIGRLLLMHANSREDIDVARTGDIVAVAGLKNVITGETLCDEKHPVLLERMEVGVPRICQISPWSPTRVACCQEGPPQEGYLPPQFPDPVIKIAIEPKSKVDLEKMSNGLIKLAQEDPSFHFSRDEETNQTVIEGMGELHLVGACS